MNSTAHIENWSGYRELLWAWIQRTLRARYQQSLLGGLWAVIQPAAAAAIFTIIFTRFIPVDTGTVPYIVFSYSAMVPWVLFSTSIVDMTESLVSNFGLVTKIYFPREILPMAAMFARLFDAVIASFVLAILLVIYRDRLNQVLSSLLWLPLVLAIQLILMLGIGFLGAALNVFFRDIRHIVALSMQLWFYATPIIYPSTTVPESLRPFYFLNPMAGIIESYRAIILYGAPPSPYLWISLVVSLICFLIGYWFFKRMEFQFADVV